MHELLREIEYLYERTKRLEKANRATLPDLSPIAGAIRAISNEINAVCWDNDAPVTTKRERLLEDIMYRRNENHQDKTSVIACIVAARRIARHAHISIKDVIAALDDLWRADPTEKEANTYKWQLKAANDCKTDSDGE